MILKTLPRPFRTSAQRGFCDIAAPNPASPSKISGVPVIPASAQYAAFKPTSAACPACNGLVIESLRNACCKPLANVPAVASAFIDCSAVSPNKLLQAAAAPKTPTVPVV